MATVSGDSGPAYSDEYKAFVTGMADRVEAILEADPDETYDFVDIALQYAHEHIDRPEVAAVPQPRLNVYPGNGGQVSPDCDWKPVTGMFFGAQLSEALEYLREEGRIEKWSNDAGHEFQYAGSQ